MPYAKLNDISLYYEIHGEYGAPLVMSQAEADTVFDIFGLIAAALGCHYQWQRRGDAIVLTVTR